jgi:hypothetical protein
MRISLRIKKMRKNADKSYEKIIRIFYIQCAFIVTSMVGGSNLTKGANMPEMLHFAQTFFLEISFPVFA